MYTSITVDLDVEDVYDSLSERHKKTLLDWLREDGIVTWIGDTSSNLINDEFTQVCGKLAESYYRMSNEDTETVIKIMKKYN
jgi:hypothetical protein